MSSKKKHYKRFIDAQDYVSHLASRWTIRRWKERMSVLQSPSSSSAVKDSSEDSSNGAEVLATYLPAIDIMMDEQPESCAESGCLLEHNISEFEADNSKNGNEELYMVENDYTKSMTTCEFSNEWETNPDDDVDEESCINEDVEFEAVTNHASLKNGTNIVFTGTQLNVNDVLLMITSLVLKHSLSTRCRKDIIEMVCLFAGNSALQYSNYMIDKMIALDASDANIYYNFYCTECCIPLLGPLVKQQLVHKKSILCESCKKEVVITKSAENYFLTFNLKYQFKILLEENTQYIISSKNSAKSNISDIMDSILYKIMTKNSSFHFSYIFNIDGAPIFNSSKLSVWPIQLCLNELDIKKRFKSIVLGGLFYGKKEKNIMQLFLKAFVDQAKILVTDGVDWQYNGHSINSKIIPLGCCADSVARPLLQNYVQFNGSYGCPWCYHPGKSELMKCKGKRSHIKQIKYPTTVEPYDNRSPSKTLDHMMQAMQDKTIVFGVKGPSALINLPEFNIVWGFPPDYMHSVLLGVTRQLWDLWTTYDIENRFTFYIGNPKTLKIINDRLTSIHPPKEIHRLPREIGPKWKATEWKSWLLFYSLPCLSGILKTEYLEHFALLQNGLFLLLTPEISDENIRSAEEYLSKFVKDMEIIYGASKMSFNVHMLSHLTMAVKQLGPLWAYSAFPFESEMFYLKEMVNGPKKVDKQIAKNFLNKFHFSQTMKLLKENVLTTNYYNYLFKDVPLIKHAKKIERVQFLGTGYSRNLETLYNRCIIDNTLYDTSEYASSFKSDNSIIRIDNSYFQILNIILSENNECILKVFKIETRDFIVGNVVVSSIKEMIRLNVQFATITIGPGILLNKCIYIRFGNESYICELPNTLEIQ